MLHIFLLLLANHCMNDCLQNELFGKQTLQVLDQLVSFIYFVIFKIIYDKVQACLWNHIDKRGQYLQSVLATPKDNKIMPQQIVVLEHVSRG
jgi:hypothetical protein